MVNQRVDNPTIITLDMTYKCTLRCLHCFNSSGEHNTTKKELTDSEILRISDDIAKLNPSSVCLCGGETLLRKDLLFRVISNITTKTNGRTQVNIVTNGELLTEDVAKKLKQSGVGMVQVSLDGYKKETHEWLRNKKGVYDSAINAIKNLNSENITIGVSCTPTKKNISEYNDVIKLCESLGVYSFRVQPLMLMGRAKNNLKDYTLNFLEYMKIKRILDNYNFNSNHEMITEWGDPIDHLTSAGMDNTSSTISINIDAYGNIQISPYIPIRIGDIKKHSILEYWEAGLNIVWSAKFIKELCRNIKSAEKMELNDIIPELPKNYIDEPLYIDIIETPNFFDLTLSDILKRS